MSGRRVTSSAFVLGGLAIATVLAGAASGVHGTVRGPRGSPVAGATVVLVAPHGLPAGGDIATTDGEGRFSFQPWAAKCGLWAQGAGLAPRWLDEVRTGRANEVRLDAGRRLRGQVRDPSGRPAADVRVRAFAHPAVARGLYWIPGVQPAEAFTDSEGAFSLCCLGDDPYDIQASQEGGASAWRRGVTASPVTLRLEPSASIKGTAVDVRGRAVQGVVVRAERAVSSSALAVPAERTSSAGRFEIGGLESGRYAISAWHAEHAPVRLEGVEVAPGARTTVDLVLHPGRLVEGRLVDEAHVPVGGRVTLADPENGSATGLQGLMGASASEQGRFALLHAPIVAAALEIATSNGGSRSMELPPGTSTLDLGDVVVPSPGGTGGTAADRDGQQGGRLFAHVLDEAGEPVASLVVTLERDDDEAAAVPLEADPSPVEASTGGWLVDGLAPGSYSVTLASPGRASVRRSPVRIAEGATTTLGRVVLPPGGALRGSVLDRYGAPVSDASVVVMRTTDGARLQRDVTTADDGTFEMVGLAAGTLDVRANHPDFVPSAPREVEIDPLREAHEIEIVLSEGGRIEGTATSRIGAPLAGARVSATLERGARGFIAETEVESDGTFVMERMTPGDIVVTLERAVGPGALVPTQSQKVSVVDGGSAFVEFTAREVVVSGRVTGRGTPRAGYGVELVADSSVIERRGGAAEAEPAWTFTQRRTVTGPDGSYRVVSPEPGRVTLVVTTPDGTARYPPREVILPDTDAHTVDIEVGGVPVTGRVVDAETRRGLAAAEVGLHPADGSMASLAARTIADGSFSLEAEPGAYRLVADAEGYAPASRPLTVADWGARDLRVLLTRGRAITGQVMDPAGNPVAGAAVTLLDPVTGRQATTRTDAAGAFRIHGLGQVAYTLAAGGPRVGYAIREVPPDWKAPLVMSLRPGGVVRVSARDASGAPVPGAYPWVVRVDGLAVAVPVEGQGATDALGVVDLPAPAGLVEIELRTRTEVSGTTVGVAESAVVPVEVTF